MSCFSWDCASLQSFVPSDCRKRCPLTTKWQCHVLPRFTSDILPPFCFLLRLHYLRRSPSRNAVRLAVRDGAVILIRAGLDKEKPTERTDSPTSSSHNSHEYKGVQRTFQIGTVQSRPEFIARPPENETYGIKGLRKIC